MSLPTAVQLREEAELIVDGREVAETTHLHRILACYRVSRHRLPVLASLMVNGRALCVPCAEEAFADLLVDLIDQALVDAFSERGWEEL